MSTPSTRSSTGRAGSPRSRRKRRGSRCPRVRSPLLAPPPAAEAYAADDRRLQTKGYAHLTLLAETNEGYGNLIKLCSLGYLEGYYYKPRVDWELLQSYANGLAAL